MSARNVVSPWLGGWGADLILPDIPDRQASAPRVPKRDVLDRPLEAFNPAVVGIGEHRWVLKRPKGARHFLVMFSRPSGASPTVTFRIFARTADGFLVPMVAVGHSTLTWTQLLIGPGSAGDNWDQTESINSSNESSWYNGCNFIEQTVRYAGPLPEDLVLSISIPTVPGTCTVRGLWVYGD